MQQSKFRILKESAIKIEKVWRGYSKGRKVFQEMKKQKETKMRFAFYHFAAALIQKMWKGHFYRKKYLNFAERNSFLGEVEQQNQFVEEMLKIYEEKQKERLKKEVEEKTAKKLDALAKNMHHLVSTKAIKGVFQPKVEETLHKTSKLYSPLKTTINPKISPKTNASSPTSTLQTKKLNSSIGNVTKK